MLKKALNLYNQFYTWKYRFEPTFISFQENVNNKRESWSVFCNFLIQFYMNTCDTFKRNKSSPSASRQSQLLRKGEIGENRDETEGYMQV